MQPPLLLTWLSKIDLTADSATADKRWKLAVKLVEKLTRKQLTSAIRIFLFPSPAATELAELSSLLITGDKNFTGGDKPEYVRLMAGLIALAAVEGRTAKATAFVLGFAAADFPKGRSEPIQPAITSELAKYVFQEGNRLRPADFATIADKASFTEKLYDFASAFDGEEDEQAARASVEAFSNEIDEIYGVQLRRLAEETSILWWLLAGYSPSAGESVGDLDTVSHALPAAAEAAERTQTLPPSPSIHAILARVLDATKGKKGKVASLGEIVAGADKNWRALFVPTLTTHDCVDLVPISTALAKVEELGDADALEKVLGKACPGVSAGATLLPSEASSQFYNELVFMKALSAVD